MKILILLICINQYVLFIQNLTIKHTKKLSRKEYTNYNDQKNHTENENNISDSFIRTELFLHKSSNHNQIINESKIHNFHKEYSKIRQDDNEDEKQIYIHSNSEEEQNNSKREYSKKFNNTIIKNNPLKDDISSNESNHILNNQDLTLKNSLDDKIVEKTDGILNDICNSSLRLSKQMNQIIENLKEVKDQLLRLHSKKFSKQKLYTKFTLIANFLNINVSNLYRVRDIIDILKVSNCDLIDELFKKYSEIRHVPEKLREMLSSELNKSEIKMKIIVIN